MQKAQLGCAKRANTHVVEEKKIMTLGKAHKKEAAMKKVANQNFLDEMKPDSVDDVIDRYKSLLAKNGSAQLDHDRDVLLTMYDRLQTRKIRREQKLFYQKANADEIADKILELTTEEIEKDEARK